MPLTKQIIEDVVKNVVRSELVGVKTDLAVVKTDLASLSHKVEHIDQDLQNVKQSLESELPALKKYIFQTVSEASDIILNGIEETFKDHDPLHVQLDKRVKALEDIHLHHKTVN